MSGDGDRLLYRPEEAAELLAIGRWKLFELLAQGEIESVKIGSARRVLRTSLEAYVARLAGGGDAAA
jgi:excisionase family DNA binding protein